MKELRMKLKIEFLNESGIDSGGLTKDWFLNVSKNILDVRRGLFQEYKPSNCYHIDRRSSIANEEHLNYFVFYGKVLAKAIFERQQRSLQANRKCTKRPRDRNNRKRRYESFTSK